jgi:hypothetical protein
VRRSIYDSEYERVRREAARGRSRPEFPESDETPSVAPVNIPDDGFKERMTQFGQSQTKQRDEARAKADQYTASINERMLRREYTDLGLTPPEPLVSLAVLKLIGWKIEKNIDAYGKEVFALVKPDKRNE